MLSEQWKKLVLTIPRELSYKEAAQHIGQSYHMTRHWMLRFGRRATRKKNGQTKASQRFWSKVDWQMWDVDIAKIKRNPRTGKPMSRERVRQVRKMYGKPIVGKPGPRPKILVDKAA